MDEFDITELDDIAGLDVFERTSLVFQPLAGFFHQRRELAPGVVTFVGMVLAHASGPGGMESVGSEHGALTISNLPARMFLAIRDHLLAKIGRHLARVEGRYAQKQECQS